MTTLDPGALIQSEIVILDIDRIDAGIRIQDVACTSREFGRESLSADSGESCGKQQEGHHVLYVSRSCA